MAWSSWKYARVTRMKVVVMTSIGAAAQKDERESKVDRVVVRSMLNAV